jgi:hypothetical protein
MLHRFIELHRASDEEILKYAKDWGILGLCAHGMPSSRSITSTAWRCGIKPCAWVPSPRTQGLVSVDAPFYPGFFREDLAAWRRLSSAAAATIQIAANLSRDQFDESDVAWRSLLSQTGSGPPNWGLGDLDLLLIDRPLKFSEKLRAARGLLAREVKTWMDTGGAGLSFSCERGGRWRISFASRAFPNLFGLLALKLMFTISESDGIVFCSTCPRAYLPNERRPSAGRANYCEVCKADGTMWREIKRRQRRGH